jgi:hypothetical protein
MKKALTLFVFVLGTAAFANTDDSFYPVPTVDNHETLGTKKGTGKIVKAQEPSKAPAFKEAEQPKEKPHKSTATSKVCSTPERSTFGITGYFVDFVHKSNVKLVNMLLD